MAYITPDLCDDFPEVKVVEPMFTNFGGKESFGGQIVTIKCFEDNSLVKQEVAKAGEGRVLVVDGGASLRCALLGDMLAQKAQQNNWSGLIIYGCIRDVDVITQLDIGVQALATHPRKTEKLGVGEYQKVLNFGGVEFAPGDFVYADNNGIIVSKKELPEAK